VHGHSARHFRVVVGELHGQVNVELGELGNARVAVELLDIVELGEDSVKHCDVD